MIVYGQISFICLHANEGRKSKRMDCVYNAHLNFRSFFCGKKVSIIHGQIRYLLLSISSLVNTENFKQKCQLTEFIISCQLLVVTIWNIIKQEHLKEEEKIRTDLQAHNNTTQHYCICLSKCPTPLHYKFGNCLGVGACPRTGTGQVIFLD